MDAIVSTEFLLTLFVAVVISFFAGVVAGVNGGYLSAKKRVAAYHRKKQAKIEKAVKKFRDNCTLTNCHENHALLCDLNADMGWTNGSGNAYERLNAGLRPYE